MATPSNARRIPRRPRCRRASSLSRVLLQIHSRRADQRVLAGTRREQRTHSRAHQLHVWLHILFVLRFCRLQRLRHCAELPVWRSHAGKFRSSVSRPEYPRLLEPLAHHAFILVPRSRLHAFSACSRARSLVCQQAYRRDPRLFSRFWIDGFVARNRAALHSLWALSGNAPFSFPRLFDQKKAI